MVRVIAEEVEFDYVRAEDAQSALTAHGLLTEGNLSLATGGDTRLAIFKGFFSPCEHQHNWLAWQDPIDLLELDRLVSTSAALDVPFSRSYRTIVERTVCPHCALRMETLILPPGEPYPGNPTLASEKRRKLRYLQCPRCHQSTRRALVKVIRWL